MKFRRNGAYLDKQNASSLWLFIGGVAECGLPSVDCVNSWKCILANYKNALKPLLTH